SINHLIKLILSLSLLTNNDFEMIIKVLSEQGIRLDIEKVNREPNINFNALTKTVTDEAKKRIEQTEKWLRWLTRIRNNPFSFVQSFLSRLIVKLAHSEDQIVQKKAQKEISEALNPLEAHVNGSSWTAEGMRLFSPLLDVLVKNQKELQEAKNSIGDQIT